MLAVANVTPPDDRVRAMIERHVVSALENRDMHAVMWPGPRGVVDSF